MRRSRADIAALAILALAFGAFLTAGCGGDDDDQAADPVAILEQWEAAWNAGDVDAVVALYAEDAYIEFDYGLETLEGREAIRADAEKYIGREEWACGNYRVDGETVTYDCVIISNIYRDGITGERDQLGYHYEAVVVDGKIQSDIEGETFLVD